MNCEVCHKPLTNNTDTYGEVGQEMCWECWSELVFEEQDPYLDIRKLMTDEPRTEAQMARKDQGRS